MTWAFGILGASLAVLLIYAGYLMITDDAIGCGSGGAEFWDD